VDSPRQRELIEVALLQAVVRSDDVRCVNDL
jgi:hypothetical protein